MRLKELKTLLYSNRGYTQYAIIYDSSTNTDVATGAVDYLVGEYGEKEVKHIEAFENQLIITI